MGAPLGVPVKGCIGFIGFIGFRASLGFREL